MYAYADAITDELIDTMARNEQVCKYLDIPIQHASNKILKSMRRHESAELIAERITKLRKAMPDIVLRSTVMLGFPGETEEIFNFLDFIEEIQLIDSAVSCFHLRTERRRLMSDPVDPDIAAERYQRLMEAQKDFFGQKQGTVSVTSSWFVWMI